MEESDTEIGATVRIFVGGLGESVKEDELRNIFGSFGSVQGSVDIIRTKGRSFAYCDFIPSSPNCLTKLFGIYNGCVWKGGRLKLEKAKEHFLIRLKREWEEDSAPPENAVDVDTMSASVDEPKKVFDPTDQMKLFIPRLRKVKSLPLKGTGKHKYSFQRYNAPIVPKHFCDCEEHSGPPEEPFKEQTSKFDLLNGGMDTEEISLMTSVMNKFLEKEIRPKVVENVKNAAIAEKEVSVINSDKLQEDANMEEDLSEEDMDDLVTNIVTTSRTATKKVLRSDRAETSKDGSSRKKSKMEKTVGIAVLDDDDDGNGDDLQINTRATVLGTQPPAEPVFLSRPRSIWSQKSSWKELIGNGKNDTFTVSNILKDTALKEEQLQMSNGNAGEANSSDSESSHDLVEEETDEDDEEDTESSKSDDSAEEEEEDEEDTDPSESDDLVEEQNVEEDGTSEPSESVDLVEEEDGTTEPSKGDGLVGEEEEDDGGGDDDDDDDGGNDDDDDVGGADDDEDDDDDVGGGADDDDDEDEEEKEDGTTEPLKRSDLIEETTAGEVPPSEPSKMEEDTEEVVTKTSDTYMNSGRGSAWRHQSSWTELLKAKSNTSFSLSGICPSQKEGAKDDDTNLESTQTVKPTPNAVVEEMVPAVKKPKDDNKVKMFRRPKPKKVIDGGSGAKVLTEMVAGGEGEVCRFMRSSASVKDWVKSKTALSAASRKRKKKTEGSE